MSRGGDGGAVTHVLHTVAGTSRRHRGAGETPQARGGRGGKGRGRGRGRGVVGSAWRHCSSAASTRRAVRAAGAICTWRNWLWAVDGLELTSGAARADPRGVSAVPSGFAAHDGDGTARSRRGTTCSDDAPATADRSAHKAQARSASSAGCRRGGAGGGDWRDGPVPRNVLGLGERDTNQGTQVEEASWRPSYKTSASGGCTEASRQPAASGEDGRGGSGAAGERCGNARAGGGTATAACEPWRGAAQRRRRGCDETAAGRGLWADTKHSWAGVGSGGGGVE